MTVTKGDKVTWSKTNDRHSGIRAEFGMPENGARITSVQVEVTPANGDFNIPLPQWDFRVDQDQLPDWWDAKTAEAACRLALEDWAKARLIRAGETRASLNKGELVTALLPGGTLSHMSGGTLSYMFGGTLSCMSGGTLSHMSGGTLSHMSGGTLSRMSGGCARVTSKTSKVKKFAGTSTVIIDDTVTPSKPYIGAAVSRIFTR